MEYDGIIVWIRPTERNFGIKREILVQPQWWESTQLNKEYDVYQHQSVFPHGFHPPKRFTSLPDLVTSRKRKREPTPDRLSSPAVAWLDCLLAGLDVGSGSCNGPGWASDKVVREKSSGVLWPKNHGKRYGSKMIQNHRSFPGFHSKADGKIPIMINLPGVHSVLHSRVAGNHNGHPTTYGNWCFHSFRHISAKWLVAPRAEGVKGLLLLEQERWPVEVFSFYPKILIFRIMIFHGSLSKKNGCLPGFNMIYITNTKMGDFSRDILPTKNSHVDLDKPSERPSGFTRLPEMIH